MYARGLPAKGIIVPCVIDGQGVPLPNTQNFAVIQGASEKIVCLAQGATVEVAARAVDVAAQAFKSWKKVPVLERVKILNRAADILEQQVHTVTTREVLETSCDADWSRSDCFMAAKMIRQNAATALTVCGSIPPSDNPEKTSLVFKEPVGVVMIIPPWNAPMLLACRGISAALAAGCTVVLKASELCPWSHHFILELFKVAGLPDGVLNKIQCPPKDARVITEAVIRHPSLRKIEFIGSENIGRIIGCLAGRYLKPILMELGDQSPAIVLEDADLRITAERCVFGALINHGQACFSTERILVHEKVKDAFLEHLNEFIKAAPAGQHAVSSHGAKRAHALIAEAVTEGAQLLIGENKLTGPSSLQPSILTNIEPRSRINREELWAPCASLATFSTIEEAVKMANKTNFGLSASIFTRDYATALKMARELEFGQVQINACTFNVNSMAPVTGYKNSGWGSNGGAHGVEEFMFNKHVCLN